MWPFTGRSEKRAVDYTDEIVNRLLSQASGATSSRKVAAVEASAGLWGRAFAIATVGPATAATAALDAYTLGCMGRSLFKHGQFLAEIVVDEAGVFLDVADSWDIEGTGPYPTWFYRLTFARPSITVTRSLPASRVVHIRLPEGGPLGNAGATVDLLAALDAKLAMEADGPVGSIMPVPVGQKDLLSADIKALKGKLGLMETARAFSADSPSAPAQDYVATRFGANPPEVLVKLRESAERSIFAAAGLPMLASDTDGTAQREAFRRFLHSTIAPTTVIAAAELAVKLDTPGLQFNHDRLFASDLSGRARAFGSMVTAGMPVDKAAALAGLMVGDDDIE